METTEQGKENIQIVEFEEKYTQLKGIENTDELQKKLTITSTLLEKANSQLIPLFRSLDFYTGNDSDILYRKDDDRRNLFKKIFPHLKSHLDAGNTYIPLSYLSDFNLITIDKIFQLKNKYFIKSKNGYVFSVEKDEFESLGFMAKSLTLIGEPPEISNHFNRIKENNGKIEYYLNGELEGTLEGNCFAGISNENKSKTIYVGKKSYLYKSTFSIGTDKISKKNKINHTDSVGIELGLGEIKKINLDPKQNFLFIISEDENGDSNLHIIDHKKLFKDGDNTIEIIKTISGVKDIHILNDGDIYLTKSNGTTDIINTNLNNLDNTDGGSFRMKKMEINKAKNKTKQDMVEALGTMNITIDKNEILDECSEEDKKIIEAIRGKVIYDGKTLKEIFEEAKTLEEIKLTEAGLNQIVREIETKLGYQIPEAINEIKKEILSKKNIIALNEIFSELDEIIEEINKAKKEGTNLTNLLKVKEKLKNIKKKRKNITISNIKEKNELESIIKKDKDLDEYIIGIDELIKKYQESNKEELEKQIENNLIEIEKTLNDIQNAIDINIIYDDENYIVTNTMIESLEESLKEKYKKKLKELIKKRREEIRNISIKEKKQEEERLKSLIKGIEEDINEVKEIIKDIDEIESIEGFKDNDPLVKKIEKSLENLPSSVAQQLEITLRNVFSDRILNIRLRGEESKGIIKSLDSYGIDTILYYNEDGTEKVEYKIEGKENQNGTISLVVKLINGETHEYDKGVYLKNLDKADEILIGENPIKFDMTEQEFTTFIRRLLKWNKTGKSELAKLSKKIQNETDENKKEEAKKEFKELKEYYKQARYTEALIQRLIKEQKLNPRSLVPPFDPDFIVLDEEKEILERLSARLVDQKQNSGIEILEGGPGLGKTVMCEFLASVTNREIIRVQCSKMDPSDMFFAPTLKKGETTREPADWIKLMQKPGTIILFDEIDKLNDQCFERLHSLFDRSRSVYDPQLGKVKANQDCLFLGTRNSYDRLSNPILSRGRILQINYPGVLNEAFKISKYTENKTLKKLKFEEFETLYEKYITRGEGIPTNAQEKTIYNLIININHLLNIFNKLREQYSSDRPFKYELSYRDARQVFVDLFVDYKQSGDFKSAIENILIPKARGATDDQEEKIEQEELVRQIINEEMGI